MKVKEHYLLIILLSILHTSSVAQSNGIRQLQIGEYVPNIEINNLINYPSKSVDLSKLKGKLVILDFWGVHCSSCIREMPKIFQLQKEFDPRVQFFLITSDSKKAVDNLYRSSPNFRSIHLPIVFSDTILAKMFPYNAYGLHVWIDPAGKLQFKTDSNSYTARDIQDFLDGKKIDLIERADTIVFDQNIPLWLEGNGRQLPYFKYQSFITENIPGYASGGGYLVKDSLSGKIIGVHFINMGIIDMFSAAFSEWGKVKWDKLVLDVKDSSKYLRTADPLKQYQWFRENTFSYELKLPVSKSEEVFPIMRQDLQRYFGLAGKIEKLEQPCWLLRLKKDIHPRSVSESENHDKDLDSMQFNNINPGEFAKQLSSFTEVPIFDETDYHGAINLSIHVSKTRSDLNIGLDKYGFELVETKRMLDVFELKELN